MNFERLKNLHFDDIRHAYTQRDTMLYALGLGYGSDPCAENELRYVYEKQLVAVPTMACVLGWPHFWARNPDLQLNYAKIVHAEQDLLILRPIPTEGEVIGRNRVGVVSDMGPEKGALVTLRREIVEIATGTILAVGTQTLIMRGDGGFSRDAVPSIGDARPPVLPAIPDRQADLEMELATLPQAGLIYRLSGDYNPLHVDPSQAAKGGFPRPLLHGLCSYGMAARALIAAVCDGDAARLKRLALRFSAPVFPGETLRFQIWKESPALARIRAQVVGRNAIALDRGVAEVTV